MRADTATLYRAREFGGDGSKIALKKASETFYNDSSI